MGKSKNIDLNRSSLISFRYGVGPVLFLISRRFSPFIIFGFNTCVGECSTKVKTMVQGVVYDGDIRMVVIQSG